MLAAGRTRAASRGFGLANANVYALPFANRTFDLVTNTISYHWYLEYPRALDEIRRVLRPGGHLVMATLSSPFLRSRVIRRAWELSTADRVRAAFPTELAGELRAAGFHIEANAWIFPLTRIFVARRQRE
jgi:ubiquinone/menaquinone biosynthesis C-methylase UbiE